MNLFVVGWNCQREDVDRAAAALRAMTDTYPLLDSETFGLWENGQSCAAWLHSPNQAAGPRQYTHCTDRELVLYSGTLLDARGQFNAHDASVLARHWDRLPEHLEGPYTAIRIDKRSRVLEVVNDPLGMHPTFVHRQGHTWWISNTARLLARVASRGSIDLAGVAHFVGMHWPGGNRTLLEGIEILPAAQHWRWSHEPEPRRKTYFPASELAGVGRRAFRAREAEALASELGGMLSILSQTFAPLQCPITAGRDSRVMTGLMMAHNLPGDFFTGGLESQDAVLGAAIARRFALPHRRGGTSKDQLTETWNAASRRVVQQCDGMVTLAHAHNSVEVPEALERIPVHLYGGGGEHARGKALTATFILRRPSAEAAIRHVSKRYGHRAGLLRPEGREMVRNHIWRTCHDLLEQGFAQIDLPDAFFLTDYSRRWGGAQLRQGASYRDVFSPFCTRTYLRAAFATPPAERLTEQVPFEMLSHLSPELLAMPFADPWPPRSPVMLLLRTTRQKVMRRIRRVSKRSEDGKRFLDERKIRRHRVLQHHLPLLRERYLDRVESPLWHIVDKARFEQLTSPETPASVLMDQQMPLLQALTVFAFEEDLDIWLGRA